MIKKCNTIEDKIMVQDYIGEEYYKCIYLYMDLKKYGTNTDNVDTWIQFNKNEEIDSVFLKYYNGLHIYSKNKKYDIEELANFILELKPTMVCGEKDCLKRIENIFLKNNYEHEEGWVRRLEASISNRYDDVLPAEKDDFSTIARLIYEDEDLGSSYDLENLQKQLYERNLQGFARNYVIKNDDKVIAHAGTGAEDDRVSMLGFVITDKDFRGQGLATKVCSNVCYDLQNEGKDVFLINYSNESTKLYDKLGFKVCCEWEKIFLNLK